MRPARIAAALAAFAGLCALVVLAGGPLAERDEPSAPVPAVPQASPAAPASETGSPSTASTAASPDVDPAPPPARSGATAAARPVSPDVVAPPPLDPATLDRVEPRGPLSDIALALPPKPLPPDKWKGKPLFRPLADAAGRFAANGFTIAIAGVEPVEPGETCGAGEQEWPCGMRARTAFRQWLRGRALSCTLPEEGDPKLVVASCRLGKQDAGEWLVANGWARAVAGGPYDEAGRVARERRRGMFGDAPTSIGFTASTTLPPSTLPEVEMPDGVLEPVPAEVEPQASDETPG